MAQSYRISAKHIEKIKIIIFLTFCFLQGIPQSHSQDDSSSDQVKLDSLYEILNNPDIDDTTRVITKVDIGDLAAIFRVGYWDSIQYECAEILQKDISEKERNTILFNRAASLNNLGYVNKHLGNYQSALKSYFESVRTIKSIDTKRDTSLYLLIQRDYAQTINNIAVIYVNQGDHEKGVSLYEYVMKIRLRVNDKEGAALTLNNLGYIASNKGDIKKALDYYFQSLKIREEINDYHGLAQTTGNIAVQYAEQNQQDESLKYYRKSLEYWKQANDRSGVAYIFGNLGTHYLERNDFDSAQYYYEKALLIRDSLNIKEDVASSYYSLGNLYARKNDQETALSYFSKSLSLFQDLSFRFKICDNLNQMAKAYYKLNEIEKSKELSSQAFQIAKELGYTEQLTSTYLMQYVLNKYEGNFKDALTMHELHIHLRDSVKNEQNQKETIKKKIQYDYEKQKAIDDKEHEKQMAISTEVKKKQKIIIYAVLAGFGLVLIFSIIIYNRLKITRRQKDKIGKQKHEIEQQKTIVEKAHEQLEEKNKEILDSINYAKRIQTAILPPQKIVKKYLKDSFILYKPKDIVAGDFYWIEHKEGKILFAAADCTGHGVPGAMVSVVCNNGLNRAVREHGLSDPGKILDKTREIVIQEFRAGRQAGEKSDEDVKDGMDVALCSLEGNTLKYAGAHNPLWIVRNGEIIETKADKQPIGSFINPLPYTTHTFELQKGDCMYIFSDGYVDQFGGENHASRQAGGKKFKAKAFRELLLDIQDKPMDNQKEIIDDAFENWRGNVEQVDDVCVIGVRIM